MRRQNFNTIQLRIHWLFILCGCLYAGCVPAQEEPTSPKINGLSFVGGPNEVDGRHIQDMLDVHANHISVMPFAYGSKDSAHLRFKDLNWQWWGESPEGVAKVVMEARKHGLEAMMKPHVWIDRGYYTGSFGLSAEEDWISFENDYREYIMAFAHLSEKLKVPMFCIGTELSRFVEERPDFWFKLIKEVRAVYSGKLTYAANWDAYEKIPFWDKLDYIGVDAYFPLCKDETPSVKAMIRAWYPHVRKMKAFAARYDKQILFAEWGFRSSDYCAREPWNFEDKLDVNLEAQKNAFEATFMQLWGEPWFAGGYLWKWFPVDHQVGGHQDTQFTPQNKPAETVIRDYFKAHAQGQVFGTEGD